MKNKSKILYLVFIGLALLGVDQLIKWLVVNFVPEKGYFVFERWFGIAVFSNEGVAFGLPMPKVIFYIVVVLILYFLLQKFQKELKQGNLPILLGLTLVITGAVSNIIDRVARGFVVDYFHLFDYSVFNLADVYIVIGIIILIWLEFKKVRSEKPKETKTKLEY